MIKCKCKYIKGASIPVCGFHFSNDYNSTQFLHPSSPYRYISQWMTIRVDMIYFPLERGVHSAVENRDHKAMIRSIYSLVCQPHCEYTVLYIIMKVCICYSLHMCTSVHVCGEKACFWILANGVSISQDMWSLTPLLRAVKGEGFALLAECVWKGTRRVS